jgi:hypothetical protein
MPPDPHNTAICVHGSWPESISGVSQHLAPALKRAISMA